VQTSSAPGPIYGGAPQAPPTQARRRRVRDAAI
jgi:hypothetical protein